MKLNYKDFNEKTYKAICKLPGIGKKTADNIVAMRPFRSNEDLFKIRGLGNNTLMKLGIEKKKKPRKTWFNINGVEYPHYCFAFDERYPEVMDFFWRIPREFRLYYGKLEESKELTKKLRAKIDVQLENL
tara:strand:+ start:772 stop:1161 length:390 start_codon:yes stop_codon:yes gene_type:complete